MRAIANFMFVKVRARNPVLAVCAGSLIVLGQARDEVAGLP
jgi:hypothetical protein